MERNVSTWISHHAVREEHILKHKDVFFNPMFVYLLWFLDSQGMPLYQTLPMRNGMLSGLADIQEKQVVTGILFPLE